MEYNKINAKISETVSENVKKIAELFPSVIKDGEVDPDALNAELGIFTEVGKESYSLNWAGKTAALKKTNEPLIGKTLKFVESDSKNPKTTDNIYIEGDNLEALKLLQNSYRGKVKMIYIDPPYNTGNDLVYNDNYAQSQKDVDKSEGRIDENGDRLQSNPKTSSRFHANWLSMIYPRIRLAKNLLRSDGVIFISVDDNERANLQMICNEIFGESNFIGCAGRISKKANNQGDYWAPNFDYILTYAKNVTECPPFFGGINYASYKYIEDSGERKGERYELIRLYMTSLDPMRGCNNQRYYIECPDGTFIIPPGENFPPEQKDAAFIAPKSGIDKVWRWSYQSYLEKKDLIVLKKGKSSNVVGVNGKTTLWNAFVKTYLNDVIDKQTSNPNSFIEDQINQKATHELNELKIPFTYAKPTSLIKYLAKICQVKDSDIVLDFFSGSGTTADAIMQLNAESPDKRQYILIQLPEKLDNTEKRASDNIDEIKFCDSLHLPRTIVEIGKERIRRAGAKIEKDHPDVDTGFKVFKVADTNIRWIAAECGTPGVTLEDALTAPSKDLRDFMPKTNDLDRVYEILIRQYGIPLTAKITNLQNIGKRTYSIADTVIVCLEENVTNEIIDKIAAIEPIPQKIVFRDSAFNDDISLKENAMMRLDALMQKHVSGGKQPYSVEFL